LQVKNESPDSFFIHLYIIPKEARIIVYDTPPVAEITFSLFCAVASFLQAQGDVINLIGKVNKMKKNRMICLLAGMIFSFYGNDAAVALPGTPPEWELVWSDEFSLDGKPDSTVWSYERGFVRNQELQWYQPDNAICKNGFLILSGRKEQVTNPGYMSGSSDWRRNRPHAEYTSSSIKTAGKKEFRYGRFEVRAKIPVSSGAWPAIWTLGNAMPWPSCGEIDLMEYYRIGNVPHILANTAWGTDVAHHAKWDDAKIPFSVFTAKDPDWADKFHVWRMDWDETAIRLYLDDELLNETLLSETVNGTIGNHANPFKQPPYILMNLALGGNGGTPDDAAFPLQYEIDYVRVYRKKDIF
jgi:beta-glucanase (GH16 family)